MIWCWFCHCFWLSFWKVWVVAGSSCAGNRQWQHGRCGKTESVLWRRPIEDIPPCRDTLLHSYLYSCHWPGRLSTIDVVLTWLNFLVIKLGLVFHDVWWVELKRRQTQHMGHTQHAQHGPAFIRQSTDRSVENQETWCGILHRNGDTDQFEMWLNAVEDPNIKDEFGRTPLSLSGINSKSSYCLSSYPISNDFLNLDRNQPSKLNNILQKLLWQWMSLNISLDNPHVPHVACRCASQTV